jgi:hypothetical protein
LEIGISSLASASEGNRNNTLFEVSIVNFRNAKEGRIDDFEVETEIKTAAMGTGLRKAEIRRTMQSAKRSA